MASVAPETGSANRAVKEPPESAQPALPAWKRPAARLPGWIPGWLAAWTLGWLAFLPLAVMRAGILTESDTFWEIRTGLVIITARALPATDSFSWTVHGRPWTLNSWGFDVLLGAAYRIGGLPGAALACLAICMLAAGLVLALARQLGAAPLVAAGMLLLAGAFVLISWIQARPELVDYAAVPCLIMLLRGIASGREPGRRVAAIGAVSCLWVNLHASALLGVAITGSAAVLVLARRPRTRGVWCACAAVAATAGALASPYGAGVIAQAARVRSESAGVIAEWDRLNPSSPMQLLILAAGLIALAVAAARRDPVLTGALLITSAGAVTAQRMQPVLMLVAIPVLAAAASRPAVIGYIKSRRRMLYPGAASVVVAFVVMAGPSLTHIGQPSSVLYPRHVAAMVPAGCRVYNSYVLGSFLILERPDVLVSLDSRNDLYGRRLVLADERVLAGHGDLRSELAGAGCVLVPPQSGLARRLYHDPAWKLRATEPAAALFLRS